MKGREFKDLVFQQFANIASSFASPKRLEIIDVLAQGERDVDTLAKETGMNFANTSRHLQIMKSIKLLESRKDGVRVYYRIANDHIIVCWKNLQSLAEDRVAELREITRSFFEERGELESISIEELWQRLQNDEVTLIDVRPKEEFESGHIPGALSIPLSELKNKLVQIPTGKDVVAYCRGPYCVLAAEAIALLKKYGYKSLRFKEDIYNWKEAGLPVES
ncbi:MAG: metalloregulator ArsR/SmtB family transcription factor [Bacteroidota bacterium]